MIECVKNGHQIVALANLKPAKQGGIFDKIQMLALIYQNCFV